MTSKLEEINSALEILKLHNLKFLTEYGTVADFSSCSISKMYIDELGDIVSKEELLEEIAGIKNNRIPLVLTNIENLNNSEDYSDSYKKRNLERYKEGIDSLNKTVSDLENREPIDVLTFNGKSLTSKQFREVEETENCCDYYD